MTHRRTERTRDGIQARSHVQGGELTPTRRTRPETTLAPLRLIRGKCYNDFVFGAIAEREVKHPNREPQNILRLAPSVYPRGYASPGDARRFYMEGEAP